MRPGARRFRRSAGPAEPSGASQPEQAQEASDAAVRLNGPGGGNGQPAGVIDGEPDHADRAAMETGAGQPDTATGPAGDEPGTAPRPGGDEPGTALGPGGDEPGTASGPTGNEIAADTPAVVAAGSDAPAGAGEAGAGEAEAGEAEAGEAEAGEAVSPDTSRRKRGTAVTRRAGQIGVLALAPVRLARTLLTRPRSDASGKAFARLTVLPAGLVIAWLVPGLPLLLGRVFSLAPMLVISIPLAAAIIVIGLRQVPARWPLSAQATAGRDGGRSPWWALTGTIAIAGGFAAWQIIMNSQQLIVTRGQGIYLQFGYWIAQHGAASIPVSLGGFGGPHSGLVFGSLGFIQRGATLVPQFLAGLPIVLAAGVWANGVHGALLVPPLLGGLAVLAFGGLVGRLAGARWAPAGALVLALALPEQYTSRSTFSEPLVQILLFGGLCLIIDSLCGPTRRTGGLLVAAGPATGTTSGPGSVAGQAGAAEVQEAETISLEPGPASPGSDPGTPESDLGALGPDSGSLGSDPGSQGPDLSSLESDPGSPSSNPLLGSDPGALESDPGSLESDPGSPGSSPHSYWRRPRSFWQRRPSFGLDPHSFEPDPHSSLDPRPLSDDRFWGRTGDPEVAAGEASAFEFGEEAAGGEAPTEQTSPLDRYEVHPVSLSEQTAPLAVGAEPVTAGRRSGWAAQWRQLVGRGSGRRARARRKPWTGPSQATRLAALGGLALGLVSVVRVDALNLLLPAIPLIGILFAARKPQWLPLSLGLLAGVGYGLADGYVLARPYLDSLASWMRTFGIMAAGVALVTMDAALIMRLAAPRRLVRRVLAARPLRWLPWAVAALTVLVVIGFAVRPYVQTVRGDTNRSMISYVGYLQRLAGLPLDPRRLYAEDTLYWVIWYIGVPAVLLGTFGLAILARRLTRSLVTWSDPSGSARIWGLALLITGWVTVTVLWRPAVAPDQPWASRRLVTVVIPGLILLAVWTAAWLTSEARQRGAGRPASSAVAAFCVAALLLPTALTTFGVGVAPSGSPIATPSSAGLALKQTSAGETGAIGRLCAAIGPDASVVILDQRTADRFAPVVRGICDTPTGLMIKASPFSVQNVIAGILRARRHPVLLGGFRAELEGYGATPREVLNLTTTQDAHELAKPPKTTWRIRYVVWMVQAAYG